MLHARAGSPVPHTEAVPPACSAFHFPCKHEESSPLAVLSLSLSPALPPAPCDSASRRARLEPVPGGAERAAGADGPCPRGLRSSSSGQAAPRRGAGKGTEPSLTANPARGARLPAGPPFLRAGSALGSSCPCSLSACQPTSHRGGGRPVAPEGCFSPTTPHQTAPRCSCPSGYRIVLRCSISQGTVSDPSVQIPRALEKLLAPSRAQHPACPLSPAHALEGAGIYGLSVPPPFSAFCSPSTRDVAPCSKSSVTGNRGAQDKGKIAFPGKQKKS